MSIAKRLTAAAMCAAAILCLSGSVWALNPAGAVKTSSPVTQTDTAAKSAKAQTVTAATVTKTAAQTTVQTAAVQKPSEVSVWLNGEQMEFMIAPLLQNGTTYVSLYDFCTMMGCRVLWHDEGYATVTRGSELDMVCIPGEIYLTANGRALYLPTPAKIIDSRIMIPIRALATVFDMDVNWNGELLRVELSGGGLLQSGDSYYDADTLYWLSRIISAEARGEPLVGQIAVGNVVFNRIADPEFPETVYGVIFDKNNGVQFTPTETGDIYESPKDISILAAKLCLEGADYSCGATYFISYKVIECWAMSNKDLLTVIGGHRFYGDK